MGIPTLTIIGVGLLGGSIGLAARRRGAAERICGTDRNPATLDRARALGILDAAYRDPRLAVAAADLVVVCTPVDSVAEQVLSVAPACRPGCLLTDVGSTKAEIVRRVEAGLPPGVIFVGSHPLAGSEKYGPENASATLFEGRQVIVTATARTDAKSLRLAATFWDALGAKVRVMAPEAHDHALALTSHLPHLAASALAGVVPEDLRSLTATGFRDTTRLAGSNPALWSAIFRANRDGVLQALDRYTEQLARFREALAADDAAALEELLREGKQVRDGLANS